MRASRRLFAAIGAAALVASASGIVLGAAPAIGSAATKTTTTTPSASLSWHSCDKKFRCARLQVPIDYQAPSKGSLSLALVELPSTSAHPVGDLLMNPGGPGGSGVQFLEQNPFPASLRHLFNLVSWDPRGVGGSDPIHCVGTATMRRLIGLNPAPTTPAEVAQVVKATKSFVHQCTAHTPKLLLENVGSIQTIQDMNRIRVALGETKLNYLGFSYGTYLGELYAARYPTHIRAMVLDGVVDPALNTVTSDVQQAQGFETDLKDFFAWCPTNKACTSELPQGARNAYDTLFGAFAHGHSIPAQLPAKFGGLQQVNLGVAEVALAGSMYSRQSWPDLALALQQGLARNGTELIAIAYYYEGLQANGTFDNELAAEVATDCVDRPSPTKLSTYKTLSDQMARVAPDFGASEAWGSLTCAYWPVKPQATPHPITAKGAPPILLVGSTADPATPYRWAQAVAHQLAHAVLLTRQGPGHTGYFFSTCIQADVNRYLATLKLPAPGTVCPTTS